MHNSDMGNKVSHISLDIWLTLLRSNPLYKPARARLFKTFFNIDADHFYIEKTIRYYDELFSKLSEFTCLHISRNQVLEAILKNLSTVYTQNKPTEYELYSFFHEMNELFRKYPPIPIVPDFIQVLKSFHEQGITFSILSNTCFVHGSEIKEILNLHNWGDYLCFQIYSDEHGYAKPSKQIFEKVFNFARAAHSYKTLKKSEILHIGDNKTADYRGSLQFGIKSAIVSPERLDLDFWTGLINRYKTTPTHLLYA